MYITSSDEISLEIGRFGEGRSSIVISDDEFLEIKQLLQYLALENLDPSFLTLVLHSLQKIFSKY